MDDRDGLLDFARQICAEAGRRMLERRSSGEFGRIDQKASATDLVSAVDLEIEALILGRIGDRHPDHAILTEETGEAGGASATHLWILDPLDGTRNFLHGYPFFSISLALQVEGQRQLGVIEVPYLRETFWAQRGQGAFLNGRPIRVSADASLDAALLSTGFACVRLGLKQNNLPALRRILQRTSDVRRSGSAAVDLSYVACGRTDGFWELQLAPWDVAAGTLLVEEAGGRVTDLAGGSDFVYGRQVVASNGHLHEALLAEIRDGLDEAG
jgi:myo-inositol-1(or 4)-monophosphatase